LFVKDGYESVSIRKIAEKVEYAPGTIYLYFKDKAEILDKICEDTFAKLIVRLEAIDKDKSAPLDKMRRAIRTYIQFGLDHPHHYVLTFIQAKMYAGRLSAFDTTGMQAFGHMRQGVQECIDAGLMVCDDVDELSQILWAGMHGLTSLLITCVGFPFVEPNRLIERMVETLIEGVRKKAS